MAKTIAGQHAKLGNKLIATANRVNAAGDLADQANGHGTGDHGEANRRLISSTLHSYIMLAAEQSKKHYLSDEQKKQVRTTWQPKRKSSGKDQNGPDEDEQQSEKHIKDIEQAANEFKDILVQVIGCDITNTIHSAKFQRLGETHIAKAKEFGAKLNAEIAHVKRQANDCLSKGIKNISRSIGGRKPNP